MVDEEHRESKGYLALLWREQDWLLVYASVHGARKACSTVSRRFWDLHINYDSAHTTSNSRGLHDKHMDLG